MKFFNYFSRDKKAPSIEYRSGNSSFLSSPRLSTKAGSVEIDENSVMGIAAFSRGAAMISRTISTMPVHMYKNLPDGSRERVVDNDLLKLIKSDPNPFMTAETFRQTAQLHLLLHGNAYIKIVRANGGRASELYVIHPNSVKVKAENGDVTFEVRAEGSDMEVLTVEQLIHLKGQSLDGLVGMSPITQHSRSLGIILAAETYGVNVFENGAATNFFLTMPESFGQLADDQIDALRRTWDSTYAGAKNAGKVGILPPGLDIKTVKLSAQELQLLETREYHVTEVARILNIQPHLVGDLSRATFSNIESQSIEYLQHTINPWLVAWEQALNKFLVEPNLAGHFLEFNRDSMLRTDTKSRYEAHAIALQNGILNIDEVRDIEKLNPLPEDAGQQHLIPMNMAPAGESAPVTEEPTVKEDEEVVDLGAVRQACRGSIQKKCQIALGRIAERSGNDPEKLATGVTKFLSTHLKYCERTMEPYNSVASKPITGQEIYDLIEQPLLDILNQPNSTELLTKFINE